MAHFEPRDEDVDMLLMLVEAAIPRQEAISRLKGNNNNVEQALNEFFDNKDTGTNKYRWDEGQFNSDRDGGSNNHGISFDIHAPDDPGPFGGRFDGAPSRPPSRTSNNKSPLSKVIDLTAEHAAADPSSSMNHGYNEDPELAQALAASRADLGMPPQESGVTGTDEVHFGPANRNQYEQGQWDMVPMSRTSAQEILLDPDPSDRKREPGTPAFLKPSVQDTRLNAVITIYHEIPLTRNLFLNTTDTLANYGHDAEWWSGKAIEQPTVIMEGSPPAYDEVDRELQRLMAFLDNTERSYGSVEPLTNFREVKQALRSEPDIPAAVFRAWKRIFEDQQPGMIRQIFSTGVAQEDSEDEPKNFAMLELELPSKDSSQETLYDICDEVLWPSLGPLELSRCPYLSRIAEVISFKVEGGGDDRKNVVIPAVWYPDRYLKAGRQAALDMRLQKRDIELELQQIRTLEDKLTYVSLGSGKIVRVQDLFKASLKHDEAEIEEHEQLADVDVDMMISQRQTNTAARLSQELQKVVASIDKKLRVLEVEREKAQVELRKLSKLYTEPSSEAPALHKYTLRGVSTTKSTMFICRQAEIELIDLDTDDDDLKSIRDQWWRIHYAPMGSSPVTVEKTTEAKVLEAAMESKNAILVYASEKAMNHGIQALPKPLETFVRFDNKTFKSEFHEPEEPETVNGNSRTFADGTLPVGFSSPGKRKFDESSLVNQDSNPYAPANVIARELRNGGGDDGMDITGSQQRARTAGEPGSKSPDGHDVIMGVEPPNLETPLQTQEMQERGRMPMLSRGTVSRTNTLDSMDLDQVMEDDSIAGESAAVKRVGFA